MTGRMTGGAFRVQPWGSVFSELWGLPQPLPSKSCEPLVEFAHHYNET
jgi:hypothetical protein